MNEEVAAARRLWDDVPMVVLEISGETRALPVGYVLPFRSPVNSISVIAVIGADGSVLAHEP
jgi:hypothetical protein